MGLLIQNGDTIGGISSELVDKIGKVVQTPSNSSDEFYELLFSKTADNTERTEETRKCSTLQYNPNKSAITIGSRTPNTDIGTYSVAMGILCTASGAYSHAESVQTTASGAYSHSEGLYTTASGVYSHSEGFNTVASGQGSHAEGDSTIANHRSQHVFGEFNIEDPSQKYGEEQGNYIEIVGNGTTNIMRSNARTLDWSGNEMIAGNLSLAGASSDISLTGTSNTWDGTNTSLKSALSAKATKATTLAGYGITDAKIANGTITLGSNSITPLTSHQDISGKVNKSGDTMTGHLTMLGKDLALATTGSDSDDSGDIWFKYGNGQEKCRIWTANEYTALTGLSFRMYKKDGTSLGSTTLALASQSVQKAGDTMSGALNFANGTWNKVGDDVQIGDRNVAGGLGIQGLNGNTNITFFKYSDASNYASLRYDGSNFIFNKNLYCENYAVHQKRTAVTMGTSSNNGCTSYQEMNYYNVDNNNYWMTRMCTALQTSGDVALHLQCRNTKTNGDVVQNNLVLGVNKSGSRYVSLTDASVWRSALGLGTIATQNAGSFCKIAVQGWGTSTSFTLTSMSVPFLVIGNSASFVVFVNGSATGTLNLNARCINTSNSKTNSGTGTRTVSFTGAEANISTTVTIKVETNNKVTVTLGATGQITAFYY